MLPCIYTLVLSVSVYNDPRIGTSKEWICIRTGQECRSNQSNHTWLILTRLKQYFLQKSRKSMSQCEKHERNRIDWNVLTYNHFTSTWQKHRLCVLISITVTLRFTVSHFIFQFNIIFFTLENSSAWFSSGIKGVNLIYKYFIENMLCQGLGLIKHKNVF